MRYGTVTARLARGVVLAAVGGLLTAGPAVAAPQDGKTGTGDREGSAFGLALSGPIPLAPKPAVASASGTRRAALLDEQHTKVLKASALDVAASPAMSRASVAKLRVAAVKLAADLVRAHCSGGKGAAELVDAVIAGRRLPVSPAPNTTIPVDLPQLGQVALVLNKQERVPNGTRVTAMELTAPLGKLGTEVVQVSSATCLPVVKAPSGKGAGTAPRPKPVRHDLPVTG
ncbi:choice-of-anchor P family protein [Actinomadura rupiterrae]|uniref:choice-of-anchor P family protein n=1 Tax=Actinomadura rupiterrae TaxID=559627 RepID=UPI0020A43D5D|nr:choice-of-anchor P family protein [Actinomadura rupiterrae]MCP2337734.1 hypothetical protein [Actinomadura rupiterrae]